MAKKTTFIARQTFADLLDNSFKMMGQTWKTSLILAAALFLPLSALVGYTVLRFLASIAAVVQQAQEAETVDWLLGFFRELSWMSASALPLALAGQFVYVAVSHHTALAAAGRRPGFLEIVRAAGKRFFGPVLLQSLLKTALFTGVALLITLLASFALVFAVAGQRALGPVLASMAVLLLGTAASVWLTYLFLFTTQAVVFDGETVFGGFQRSAHLVFGNWWRLFGISLAVDIIFSFAVGLISLPVNAAGMLPLFSRIFGLLLEGRGGPMEFTAILKATGVGVAIGAAGAAFVQAVLEAFFKPVFFGLFYFDLKARKGEIQAKTRRGRGRSAR